MVTIRAEVSTQQPPRNILLRAAAYDTVQKQTVLPLQEIKRETMMILKQKKVKMANEDANTRRKPNLTLGIDLTAAKVAQCRQLAMNMRAVDEAKKITVKKTATRNIHFQLKIYETFDMCINSMNILYFSTTDEYRLKTFFDNHPTPSRMPLYTLEGNWPNCLIKEGIQ